MDPTTNEQMQTTQPQVVSNPLSQFYRQPKIYIKLPSQGKFYPAGALDHSQNNEYPVFAMTARDELMFKTPDALLSGQSTTEVIKSCIPAIKEPWSMPSIDVDYCLIAIRIATYGDNMEITSTCPACKEINDHEMNLQNWLGAVANWQYEDIVNVEPLVIYLRPLSYQETTKTALKTLEQQKVFAIINDESLTDEDKMNKFGETFVKLTELTVDIITDCITKIETPNGTTTDKGQIKEFMNNSSKEVFEKVSSHLEGMKETVEIKPQDVVCSECNHPYKLPVTMDQSNFFGARS